MYKERLKFPFWILAVTLLLCVNTHAEEEFLTPDQAFAISANDEDNGIIRVVWRITDGYYMYRSKFRFLTDTPGVELGTPTLPPSQTKKDPIFGNVEVYRGDIVVELPVKLAENAPNMLTLKARSQGCADAGLCYPPHTQTLLVALSESVDAPLPVDPDAVAEMQDAISATTGSDDPTAQHALTDDPLAELDTLGDSLGFDDDEILAPEEAFKFNAEVRDGGTVQLYWQIAEGTYLYQDQVKIALSGNGVTLGDFKLPEPKIKKDSIKPDGTIGDVAVYIHDIDLLVPVLRTDATEVSDVALTVKYQGCADRGICYPPQTQTVDLVLPAVDDTVLAAAAPQSPAAVVQEISPAPVTAQSNPPVAEQDKIAKMLEGGSTWAIVGSFFVIGLLLAFTPCVFPMIPILSGIIAGQGSKITTHKAFVLSVVYVVAMALTYTVAGVLAGLFGSNLQAAFQNPWILGFFATIFVALAFSMFGFYELQLPSRLQSKLSEMSNRQEGGTLTGVAIMGLLSALIVGPCVAAAGGRTDLHRSNRGRGAGRSRFVRHESRDGRPLGRHRYVRRKTASACRRLDGRGQGRVWRTDVGRGHLLARAGTA